MLPIIATKIFSPFSVLSSVKRLQSLVSLYRSLGEGEYRACELITERTRNGFVPNLGLNRYCCCTKESGGDERPLLSICLVSQYPSDYWHIQSSWDTTNSEFHDPFEERLKYGTASRRRFLFQRMIVPPGTRTPTAQVLVYSLLGMIHDRYGQHVRETSVG